MRGLIQTIVAVFALSLSSCSDNGTPSNSLQSVAEAFPNEVGDTWTYQLTAGGGTTESIQVEVIGQGVLPNGDSATIWKYSFTHFVDTAWVSPHGNVVSVYDVPCWGCTNPMPWERLRYIFPLSVGSSWSRSDGPGDTTRVLRQGALSVPAGAFSEVFEISKTIAYVTNSSTDDTLWFKENVGLIRKNQAEFNLGPLPGNGIWNLVSYNLH